VGEITGSPFTQDLERESEEMCALERSRKMVRETFICMSYRNDPASPRCPINCADNRLKLCFELQAVCKAFITAEHAEWKASRIERDRLAAEQKKLAERQQLEEM